MRTGTRKKVPLSAERKMSILEEIRQDPSRKAEILRREGLYSTDINRYEEVAREGALKALKESKPGRKHKILAEMSTESYLSMKLELERKDNALAELAVEFTILKKKVNGE